MHNVGWGCAEILPSFVLVLSLERTTDKKEKKTLMYKVFAITHHNQITDSVIVTIS